MDVVIIVSNYNYYSSYFQIYTITIPYNNSRNNNSSCSKLLSLIVLFQIHTLIIPNNNNCKCFKFIVLFQIYIITFSL